MTTTRVTPSSSILVRWREGIRNIISISYLRRPHDPEGAPVASPSDDLLGRSAVELAFILMRLTSTGTSKQYKRAVWSLLRNFESSIARRELALARSASRFDFHRTITALEYFRYWTLAQSVFTSKEAG